MTRQAKDEAREERINMEIIVDAYGTEEQAAGWYNYLSDTLQFPFSARCVARRAISPLEPGDEVEAVGIAPAEECEHEMFVLIRWKPDAVSGKVDIALPGKLLQEGIYVESDAVLADDIEIIPPVLIGKSTRIERKVKIVGPFVIGSSVVVGEGAYIAQSVLLQEIHVPPQTAIVDALMGTLSPKPDSERKVSVRPPYHAKCKVVKE